MFLIFIGPQYFQDIYYQGCNKSSQYTGNKYAIDFYNLANSLDKISRENFINITDLNIVALTEYLKETQKNKIYMLYSTVYAVSETGSIFEAKMDF